MDVEDVQDSQLTCPVLATVGVERSQEGDASDENDEAEFFDAMEDSPAFITVTATGNIEHKWEASSLHSYCMSNPLSYFCECF